MLKLDRPYADRVEPAEWQRVWALRRDIPDENSFSTPEEASESAARWVAAWLQAQTGFGPGCTPCMEDWESQWMAVRMPLWEGGRHLPLQSMAAGQVIQRSQLYVALRATTTLVFQDEDGQVVLSGPHQTVG